MDPSKFGAKNEMEDNLNSIISFIEESWDSNSDKADDSITTSDRFMFVPNSAVFFYHEKKVHSTKQCVTIEKEIKHDITYNLSLEMLSLYLQKMIQYIGRLYMKYWKME